MTGVTLEVVSIDAIPVPGRICRFVGVGGTIGRDDGNTLVLQDKHRRVSRLHASITFPQGVPTIANASTTLPVSVGTCLLTHGQKLALRGGEQIEIGPFVLRVQAFQPSHPIQVSAAPALPQCDLPQAAPVQPLPPANFAPAAGSAVDPLAALMGGLPSGTDGDPFADLFADMGMAAPAPVLTLASLPPPVPAPPKPLVTPVPAMLPAAQNQIDPFVDFLGSAARNTGDSFGSDAQPAEPALFDSPLAPQAAPPVRSPSWDSGHNAGRAPMAIIPEDFNPFELPSQVSRNAADPLAQMLGDQAPRADVSIAGGDLSIDALFAPSAADSSPFAGLLGEQPSASAQRAVPNLDRLTAADNSDPMLMFGAPSGDSRDCLLTPVRDDLLEVGGAYQPPRAVFPNALSSRVTPEPFFADTRQGSGSAANAEALTTAFLNATGLPAEALPGGLTPELMTVIGGLLHTATTGVIDMLGARAATKLELQASVTIISSQSNNPLKFLPNAESALQQMLGKKMPGFMRADQAMRDAFDDLRAHEVGVIAGTRAALNEVLGRFDPMSLEKRLAGGSFLDSLLPSMRKTKLWEIYLDRYAKIRREAEDDFQSAFGRAFLEAYERETNRVKAHTTSGSKP